MLRRLMGAIIAITVVLASSSVAFAQNGKRAPQKPWFKIRFLNFDEVGDAKVTWELNRHQHFTVLARAFLFTGDERYVRKLEILAADYKAHSSIRWLGFVDDVVKLLRTCSILVCPSHREPLGRVIFEAWDAHVVPVVFAGSGGAAEIVTAAQGGIVYDEQTPEMLAKALTGALELDREQAARLVNNGRLWMAEQCDTKVHGEKISRILRSATLPC